MKTFEAKLFLKESIQRCAVCNVEKGNPGKHGDMVVDQGDGINGKWVARTYNTINVGSTIFVRVYGSHDDLYQETTMSVERAKLLRDSLDSAIRAAEYTIKNPVVRALKEIIDSDRNDGR